MIRILIFGGRGRNEVKREVARWVSNATRHPSHLKKRFTVRTAELWEEVGPTLEALKYTETERDVLMKHRVGRTVMGWMALLHQKYERAIMQSFSSDAAHSRKYKPMDLSEDEDRMRRPNRSPRKASTERAPMKRELYKPLERLRKQMEKEKYKEDAESKEGCMEMARSAMDQMDAGFEKYKQWLECPQFCDMLSRIGRVAYMFEDKRWIHEAYSPLILKVTGGLPSVLDLLNNQELIGAFYGLSCLGPGVLDMEIRQHTRTRSIGELLDDLTEQAFEIVDDLNGTDRCQLIEGSALMDRIMKPKRLAILLNDAYPLLKTREAEVRVHPADHASLLWAMGKHKCRDDWRIASTCLKEMCRPKRFSLLRAGDMARAIWGLSQIGVRSGHEEFIDMVQKYLQFTVDVTQRDMFNHEVVEMAEGLSLLTQPQGHREIMEYLVRDVAKRLDPLTELQKDAFMQACELLRFPVRTTSTAAAESS